MDRDLLTSQSRLLFAKIPPIIAHRFDFALLRPDAPLIDPPAPSAHFLFNPLHISSNQSAISILPPCTPTLPPMSPGQLFKFNLKTLLISSALLKRAPPERISPATSIFSPWLLSAKLLPQWISKQRHHHHSQLPMAKKSLKILQELNRQKSPKHLVALSPYFLGPPWLPNLQLLQIPQLSALRNIGQLAKLANDFPSAPYLTLDQRKAGRIARGAFTCSLIELAQGRKPYAQGRPRRCHCPHVTSSLLCKHIKELLLAGKCQKSQIRSHKSRGLLQLRLSR